MTKKVSGGPPCWLFTILMVGGFLACGVYLGMMRFAGISVGNLVRAVGFGALGFLMLWGVLARR